MNQPATPQTDEKIRTTCVVILTLIALGAALKPLEPVLVPLLLAVLLTYCLKPLIDWQQRRLGMSRVTAAIGAGILSLAILAVCALLVVKFLGQVTRQAVEYEERLNELMVRLSKRLDLEQMGIERDPKTNRYELLPPELSRLMLEGALGATRNIASSGALVLIFVLFLLTGQARPRKPGSLLDEIETRTQKYILQMIGFSFLTGSLVGFSLWVVGVDFAFAFGFVAFLLNFIPTIGPLLATLLPMPVVLLDPELSMASRVLAFALPAGIQCTFAVIQPRVQGEAQGLHPVTTLAALVFFGSIWGITGAALAVPVTGVIRIILGRIPNTRPIANWMEGKIEEAGQSPGDSSGQAQRRNLDSATD